MPEPVYSATSLASCLVFAMLLWPVQAHQQQRRVRLAGAELPRFERLMLRLDLSQKEQLAMVHVLVKQVSQEDFSSLFPKFGRAPPSFAAFADMVSSAALSQPLLCLPAAPTHQRNPSPRQFRTPACFRTV